MGKLYNTVMILTHVKFQLHLLFGASMGTATQCIRSVAGSDPRSALPAVFKGRLLNRVSNVVKLFHSGSLRGLFNIE